MDFRNRAEQLLRTWCEELKRHQIVGMDDREIDGAMVCPACHVLHGRCFESMVAFMYMFRESGDYRWLESTMKLFYWADRTLSLPDGSFQNDRGSRWVGTTVFNTIAMCDTLLFFRKQLPDKFYQDVKERVGRSAEFLYGFDRVKQNNINYPVSNALALYLAGQVLEQDRFKEKAADFAAVLDQVVTENGLILGEGVPREEVSFRGCRSVDVGYNVEETLPALIRYARIFGNEKLLEKSEKLMDSHMMFFLDDGGWDNSFGTRNFKWTYWGSRTSDGALYALLFMAKRNGWYADCASRALSLLERCTVNGLLSGGPDYGIEGERCCIHHTFEHARMLAGVLLSDLTSVSDASRVEVVGREAVTGVRHLPEIDSYIYNSRSYTSTVTFYDWGYKSLSAGHVSGGSPSLLYRKNHGPVLVSGMGEYSRREPYNMQMPLHFESHECLDFRIEKVCDQVCYSSIYDKRAEAVQEGNTLVSRGMLTSSSAEVLPGGAYEIKYTFNPESLDISVSFETGVLVVPVISRSDESVSKEPGKLVFRDKVLRFSGDAILPYGERRVFNLIPGFQALRVEFTEPVDLSFIF